MKIVISAGEQTPVSMKIFAHATALEVYKSEPIFEGEFSQTWSDKENTGKMLNKFVGVQLDYADGTSHSTVPEYLRQQNITAFGTEKGLFTGNITAGMGDFADDGVPDCEQLVNSYNEIHSATSGYRFKYVPGVSGVKKIVAEGVTYAVDYGGYITLETGPWNSSTMDAAKLLVFLRAIEALKQQVGNYVFTPYIHSYVALTTTTPTAVIAFLYSPYRSTKDSTLGAGSSGTIGVQTYFHKWFGSPDTPLTDSTTYSRLCFNSNRTTVDTYSFSATTFRVVQGSLTRELLLPVIFKVSKATT